MAEKTVNSQQIKKIHTLLQSLPRIDKKELVQLYTGARGTSTKDLLFSEAAAMIRDLETQQKTTPQYFKADKQRKLILYFAHEMGWELENGKVDIKRVDGWCVEYGQFHKKLNAHSLDELPYLVTQFENVYKSYLKKYLQKT